MPECDASPTADPGGAIARRRRAGYALLGAAFLAVELVVGVHVALVAFCLVSSSGDLATAHWLWRNDRDRLRGWLAAGSYSAWAFFKVAGVAFATVIAAGILAGVSHPRDSSGIGPPEGSQPVFFAWLLVLILVSLLMAWGLANATLGVALWKGQTLWLGPEAGLARAQRVWPPWAADDSRLDRPRPANRLSVILWFAIVPWIIVTIILEVWTYVLFLGDTQLTIGLLLGGVGASIFGIPATLIPWLGQRLVAPSPFEVWDLEAP